MEHLKGKIVKVSPPFINDKTGLTESVIGELYFIGRNEYLNWDLEVVIGKTPYQIKSINQVKVIE